MHSLLRKRTAKRTVRANCTLFVFLDTLWQVRAYRFNSGFYVSAHAPGVVRKFDDKQSQRNIYGWYTHTISKQMEGAAIELSSEI